MSLQYYGVFDSTTGDPKRFGTCDDTDVELQASEPDEVAMVCPPEMTAKIQSAQRSYYAVTQPKPFVSPFKAELVGPGIAIIAATAP